MEKFGLLALQGSGSGGGLPSVTSSDNGKALTVVDGAWAAADNDFVVTFTKNGDVSGTWSADKTFIEVKNAYDAKKQVYGKMSATDVTSDPAFSSFILLIPLSGIYGSTPIFSGTYQGQTKTVFVSFVIVVSSVTAYIKEIELAPAPLVVTYTVTGQPTNNVYPLSASHTLAQIAAARTAGREIKSVITMGSNALTMPQTSYGPNYTTFSGVTQFNDVWSIFQIAHGSGGGGDSCNGYVVPLITGMMTYNSSTNTLDISGV